MYAFPIRMLALAAILAIVGVASARDDEDKKAAIEQKKVAMGFLKKASIDKIATAETENIQLFTTYPEAKAKTLADSAQKVAMFARKTLKFEEATKLWKGKLTVYVFADPRTLGAFYRTVEQKKIERDTWFAVNSRIDPTYAMIGIDRGDKATDAEITNDVSTIVAATVLNKKAGTGPTTGSLPDWLQIGFGRAMVLRGDTKPTALSIYKAKVKTLVAGSKTKPSSVRANELWEGEKSKDYDLVAASFVEYLVYGPESEKFASILSNFKPTATGAQPTFAAILTELEWKPESLDSGWKKWVTTGK